MLNTEIKEDRLIVGNTDYPRARAESVVLGTYGKMVKAASPLFGGIQSIEEYGRWIIPEELVVGVEKMSISQDSVRSLVAKVSAEATQIQAVGEAVLPRGRRADDDHTTLILNVISHYSVTHLYLSSLNVLIIHPCPCRPHRPSSRPRTRR